MPKEALSYLEAIDKFSSYFSSDDDLYIGSFYEFIRDVWAYGFSRPEEFALRYVELICNDVEDMLNKPLDNKYYCATLPRGMRKSSILGYGFCVYRLLDMKVDVTIPYISYSEAMAMKHTTEIKRHIRSNPKLSFMIDRAPQSDSSCRYSVGGRYIEVDPMGLFSFKRGTHSDGGALCDDLLPDPENVLNLSEILKFPTLQFV